LRPAQQIQSPAAGAVVSLDEAAASDPAVAGAKGAALARARAAGFPVLDGFVIGAQVSAEALAGAVDQLATRGTGGARLSIIHHQLDEAVRHQIDAAAARLPEPLIVRSSSILEGSGEWSGAFTSVPEVRQGEVVQAARSVWATCFSLEVLDRFEAAGLAPGSAAMAVVVQPEITPEAGGVASVDGGGTVGLTAVKGSPRDLLAGWAPGERAAWTDGRLSGDGAIEVVGRACLEAVAELAAAVRERLGHNLIEWAAVDGRPVLLQSQRSVVAEPEGEVAIPAALAHPRARHLARLVEAYPTVVAEELVLPWAAAFDPDHLPAATGPVDAADAELEAEARALARRLTAEAWQLPPAEATASASAALRRLRSDRPNESIEALGELVAVDSGAAARLLGLVRRLEAARSGHRRGRGRWEPFIAGVAALGGELHDGVGAAGGIGAGRLVWVDSPNATGHVRPRDIVVVQYPLANFSPLLWDAAGVISAGGAPGAHLFEVARSLTVPAVVGCDLADLVRAAPRLGMLDGDSGRVAVLDEPVLR
jgi:phosphohistidine swiveling domain-containing protein